jgi:LAGLIDADG endonuclease
MSLEAIRCPPRRQRRGVHLAICWKTRVSRATEAVRRDVYSDNVTSAENQQERLRQLGWVIGFVDGEGCFSISFVRQPNRRSRKGYKTGYQVSHRFAVTQGMKSLACLEELRSFFGVGRIFVNRRHDNHREHLCNYVVDRRVDLSETIIPFFRRYPLMSSKQQDFEKFATCVEMIDAGRHLTTDGLVEIAEITQTMNRQKPRHELIRILRGHTPDIRDTG